MPTQISGATRQSLLDELMERVTPLIRQESREILAEKAVPRDEYRQVLSRLDLLEHDVADIKLDIRELRAEISGLRSEMNERFDRVNERFVDMERHFETRFDEMSHRLLVQTRWMIGSIALFGTIITILLAVAQFTS